MKKTAGKIYTRKGDNGVSGLLGGARVPKYDCRLEAYGTVDELSSWVGLVRSQDIPSGDKKFLEKVQGMLFIIGKILATDNCEDGDSSEHQCCDGDIAEMEAEIDKIMSLLPPLDKFILPGGDVVASYCHLARTVCRRAERRICQISEEFRLPHMMLKYINRLSDYMFALARKTASNNQTEETLWTPEKNI